MAIHTQTVKSDNIINKKPSTELGFLFSSLEWQVVCRTVACRLLCGREGSCRSLGSSLWREWSDTSSGSCSSDCCTVYHAICANLIKPTAIILVGVNVERNSHVFTHLDVELLDAILAKHAEHAFARILTRHLYYILLRHPRVTRTLRDTLVCRQYGNDFSCKIHNTLLVVLLIVFAFRWRNYGK